MFINEQTLIRLPVFTKAGEKLGHIIDIEIDIESHAVRKYLVGARFKKDIYLVTPSQIISISEEKIMVEDTILKDPEIAIKKKPIFRPGLDAALPTKTNN